MPRALRAAITAFINLFFLQRDRTFLRRAWPLAVLPPTAWKPLMPRALRAAITAFINLFFLPKADDFLVTILPFLFFIRSAFLIPPTVFSLRPTKTAYFARLPLAILLTRFAAFFFFIPLFFMDFFMDFIAFMDFFIDFAILSSVGKKFEVKTIKNKRLLCLKEQSVNILSQ